MNNSAAGIPVSARHCTLLLFSAEASNSVAASFLTVGLPFYMNHRFGWGAGENFIVAACQGILYACCALSARKLSGRWGRENIFMALSVAMSMIVIAAGICVSMSMAVPTAILATVTTGLFGASWPMLSSLVSCDGPPALLSRRLSRYNIVWAVSAAGALAGSGGIIQYAPAWAYFGIIAAALLIAGTLFFSRARIMAGITENPAGIYPSDRRDGRPNQAASDSVNPSLHPLYELDARKRRLALWLSRIALPSTYILIFSFSPLLPSLHVMQQLSPAVSTLLASTWLIARVAAFIVTGRTTFWHMRPGLMFLASATMLAAFLGAVIAGSFAGAGLAFSAAVMVLAQIVLGFSIGTIYSTSLYFGMALSDGSTEHGGYHEALIGLGQVLGPMTGAIMQLTHPGALWPAVLAISALVMATMVIQAAAGMRIAGRTGARRECENP
ncbi:MAG TPA: MFS transporter [Acidobacteriota bacterium]|nr:MFS transporter [Acidobacteriota bacterium]